MKLRESLNSDCMFRDGKRCQWFEVFRKSGRKSYSSRTTCTKPGLAGDKCGVPIVMRLRGFEIGDEDQILKN